MELDAPPVPSAIGPLTDLTLDCSALEIGLEVGDRGLGHRRVGE